jgi:hypothetical protein
MIQSGADFAASIAPVDRDLITRARSLPDCYLWMNTPRGPQPHDPEDWEVAAACFEAVAEAIDLVRSAREEPNRDSFEESLDLAAEAQSALRRAVYDIGWDRDGDQLRTYHWLRTLSEENRIFIPRHMRADDRADPNLISEILGRIRSSRARVRKLEEQRQTRERLLGKVRYAARRLEEGATHDRDQHAGSLLGAIEGLVGAGVPPSDPELRSLLLPVLDELPTSEEAPAGVCLVLREIHRYLETRTGRDGEDDLEDSIDSEEVREAARLLQGRNVLLIGGQRRPYAQQALERALGLQSLVWATTREHESVAPFETLVARPDVSLVLLAIRWSGHAFAEVQDFCARAGKPLVRLPAGYNPRQVAKQILDQCSGKLGAAVRG